MTKRTWTTDEILDWADAEMNRLEGIGLTDNQLYITKEVIRLSKETNND